MKKINNGELVELSAAGRKLDQNSDVAGLFGMVMSYDSLDKHPYKIRWFRSDGGLKHFPMARYEIKRFKGAKCK